MASLDELVLHLTDCTRLPASEARKVVLEVLAYMDEDVEAFVRRRHGELQREGRRNDEIYARLGGELAERRFAAPRLSPRQLRRIIYG